MITLPPTIVILAATAVLHTCVGLGITALAVSAVVAVPLIRRLVPCAQTAVFRTLVALASTRRVVPATAMVIPTHSNVPLALPVSMKMVERVTIALLLLLENIRQ